MNRSNGFLALHCVAVCMLLSIPARKLAAQSATTSADSNAVVTVATQFHQALSRSPTNRNQSIYYPEKTYAIAGLL